MPSKRGPRPTHLHVTVTVNLHRRFGWLMTGVAVGTLQLPDLILQATDLVLRALHRR
jgi:hypothetical protein